MKLFIYSMLVSTSLFISCKKEFDIPPVQPIAALNKINIANIKSKYAANINYRFKSDSSLYCVVTADEVSGNLFKDIYVKDVTGALHIKLVNSGGLFIGDSIRINLKDIILNENNKLIQLDSVDAEKSIVKLASGYNPQPLSLSITQINANTSATNSIQSRLVKLDNVEFISTDQNQPLADAIGKASLTRVIRSCSGQTLMVRTSGYCSFAGKLTPDRNGSITGIISQYGTTMQLLLRNYNEITMTNAPCSVTTPSTTSITYLTKDFNDNSLTSGGWSTYSVTNSAVNWVISSFSSTATSFIKISGFLGGTNTLAETWYISPAINLNNSINPALSFLSAAKFSGIALDVLVSVNYTGGEPALATWTSLTPTLSPGTGNYVWTQSGNSLLSQYKSSTTRIAFKYNSTTAGATSYELDDIVVKEN